MTHTRIHIALNLPSTIADKIAYFYRFLAALTDNPYVTNLDPPLPEFKSRIDALVASQAQVKTHGIAQRELDLELVEAAAESYRQAIENECNANPSLAPVIAESTCTSIKQYPGPHPRHDIVMRPGATPNSVYVQLKAVDGASYEIAYSLDDGATYISIGVSTVAHNTITGLTLGAVILARYRTIIGTVTSDWSDPVNYVVRNKE